MTKEQKIEFILTQLNEPGQLRLFIMALFAQALPNLPDEKVDELYGILNGTINQD